jgi:hypothetical protein
LHLAHFFDEVDRIERHITEVRSRRHVGREVGGDDVDDRVAMPGLVERPLQRVLGALGALDADDDSVGSWHAAS